MPGGLVGLRHHADDGLSFDEGLEARNGELRRAHKDNSRHAGHSSMGRGNLYSGRMPSGFDPKGFSVVEVERRNLIRHGGSETGLQELKKPALPEKRADY